MSIIEFDNVWKKFKRGRKFNALRDAIPNLFRRKVRVLKNSLNENEFWALQNVSFKIKKSEVFGIIGPNGAGKSTILKLLFKILGPNKGIISINGKVSGLIEITAGFHPELTGRENIFLNGTIVGMRKKEIDKKFNQIVDFSGIGPFIDTPVKRYSSGMYARLGFSVTAHMNPDILLVDEVLSVGDMAFQAKCSQKMRELMNSGTTIILVSHNMALIQNLAERVLLLHKGKIINEGSPNIVIPEYQKIVYEHMEDEIKNRLSKQNYAIHISQSSPVQLTDVFLTDDQFKEKQEFEIGEDLFVKIFYETKNIYEKLTFSIDILRSDGILCCSSDTKSCDITNGNEYGKNHIFVKFHRLNLSPGIYYLNITIWDKNMVYPYTINKKRFFSIKSTFSKSYNGAVFVPQVNWEK